MHYLLEIMKLKKKIYLIYPFSQKNIRLFFFLECEEYAESIIIEIPSPDPTRDGSIEKIDTCAIVEEALILGGENAAPREYPHMVSKFVFFIGLIRNGTI